MKTSYFFSQINRGLLLASFIVFSLGVSAKTLSTVKGRITDTSNHSVGYATASLVNSKSNLAVKVDVSNNNGEFKIINVQPGDYILKVSMLGYAKSQTGKITVNSTQNRSIEKSIVLKPIDYQLSEVVVTAKRIVFMPVGNQLSEVVVTAKRLMPVYNPIAEVVVTAKRHVIVQPDGKYIFNTKAYISSASESIYDMMKKIQKVSIDNFENISVKGLFGVKVLIDNKPTVSTSAQLAMLLKKTPAKFVEHIEIIENPGAHYNFANTTGTINIHTKKDFNQELSSSDNDRMNVISQVFKNADNDLNAYLEKINQYGKYCFFEWSYSSLSAALEKISTYRLSNF